LAVDAAAFWVVDDVAAAGVVSAVFPAPSAPSVLPAIPPAAVVPEAAALLAAAGADVADEPENKLGVVVAAEAVGAAVVVAGAPKRDFV